MRVDVVDPSAFTPPYDHGLCCALGHAGVSVELVTSRFAYGEVPTPVGYVRRELFYRRVHAPVNSRRRRVLKALVHGPEMLAYRREARRADLVHFQWLEIPWLDRRLLPDRPLVLTAHDLLPREPHPGQLRAQRRALDAVDAIVVHSAYGRDQLVGGLSLDPAKVHVIPHGAFAHLAGLPAAGLPPELAADGRPVVLFFGLLRPYKGLDVLLEAWRGIEEAELWIVGRPRMALEPLQAQAPPGVRFVPRFVSEVELAACFRRADIVVLPYARTERFDQSGVLASALAFGKAIVLSDIGSFSEVAALGAARLVPAGDPGALRAVLSELLADSDARARLGQAALSAAAGTYSWEVAAARTLELYRRLV